MQIETAGAFGEEATKYYSCQKSESTNEHRTVVAYYYKQSVPIQRLNVTMQRDNVACVLGTIPGMIVPRT